MSCRSQATLLLCKRSRHVCFALQSSSNHLHHLVRGSMWKALCRMLCMECCLKQDGHVNQEAVTELCMTSSASRCIPSDVEG